MGIKAVVEVVLATVALVVVIAPVDVVSAMLEEVVAVFVALVVVVLPIVVDVSTEADSTEPPQAVIASSKRGVNSTSLVTLYCIYPFYFSVF